MIAQNYAQDTKPPESAGSAVAENVLENTDSVPGRARWLKERFPEPFDVFYYYVEQFLLLETGSRRLGPVEGKLFRNRARIIFDSLASSERHQWRRIHKMLRKGNSEIVQGGKAQDLMSAQDISAKMHSSTEFIERPKTALPQDVRLSSALLQPTLVPFVSRGRVSHDQKVMLVLDTPDSQGIKASQPSVGKACIAAFAPTTAFEKVEAWSDHIWVATFKDAASASKAKGMVVEIDGTHVTAEHLSPKPPSVFICDFSNADVGDNEVATIRVSEAFAECPEKPKVRLQSPGTPYSRRQLWIHVPRPMRLIRFYIPMLQNHSDDVFLACFKPLNPTAACVLCRHRHGLNFCDSSKPIELPPQS